MKEAFQDVVLGLALFGLAASLAVLAFRSRPVRAAIARLAAIWRGLTALGRFAVCAFLLVGVLEADKTNGVNNLPPQQQMMAPRPGAIAGMLPTAGNLRLLAGGQQQTFGERWAANWNVCGAWKDSFWLPFEDGWVFPHGTNHLSGVEVVSQGMAWPTPFDTNAVAAIGFPVEIVPGLSSFGYELTPSNSYRLVWTDAAIGRDTNNLVSASIELFRNGDWCVTTNGTARWGQRALPYPHNGFGQDDEWVSANFTNAAEILSAGYSAWVDAQVGTGLTNGLYKLTVSLSGDPPETTFLSVGDLTIAATNAGEYVFLVEKGPAYDLTVFPASGDVTISAVDDIAPMERGGFDGSGQGLRHAVLRSDAGGNYDVGTWTLDGGAFVTDYVPGMGHARFWWLPCLFGSPDVAHIDSSEDAVEFHAVLSDYRGAAPAFTWIATEGLDVSDPSSQTTEVTADGAVSWDSAYIAVSATFGGDRSLSSHINLSYGTNDTPQVSCSLSLQSVLFVNEGGRSERVYPVSVSLICPVGTNGVVDISYEGSDGALFWSDPAATQPLQSLAGISLSSVTSASDGSSYTFYMTSPGVGSGSLTAIFTLPSDETRGVAKYYRVIEPIRRLVCCEIDSEYSCVYNPSRLVYGRPARLKVGANGNFSPDEVQWSVVSGPGAVARDEDDFGEVGWGATVTATAASGEVVVEARFNEDAVQPRFVLPIVQQRTLPVRVFVVNENNKPIVSDVDIGRKIDYANIIFSQIGIQLSLLSVSNNVGSEADLILPKLQLYTNQTGRTYWDVSERAMTLLNSYAEGDCMELYFVKSINGNRGLGPAAFRAQCGIVVSKCATDHVIAHEIGHALGLVDCYAKRSRGVIEIASGHETISAPIFSDRIHDWGDECGRGFYGQDDIIIATLQKMLMYGEDGFDSVDIPSGSVYSLRKNANAPTSTFDANIGANYIKNDFTEVYSK